MNSILDILSKWRNKNEAAVPRNRDEERLVTSRRAFLGLLGGTIAYAATTGPVARTLEILAEESVPALRPFDPSEGILQMFVPNKGWMSLGSLRQIRMPPPPETQMIDFGSLGNPVLSRRPAFQPRSTTFELLSVDDFRNAHSELIDWMGILTSPRPAARDYKRQLRCQCLGVTWEMEGAFLTRFDTSISKPMSDEFGDVSFEIEIYADMTRVVTNTEQEHGSSRHA